jgi:hypothetical protein
VAGAARDRVEVIAGERRGRRAVFRDILDRHRVPHHLPWVIAQATRPPTKSATPLAAVQMNPEPTSVFKLKAALTLCWGEGDLNRRSSLRPLMLGKGPISHQICARSFPEDLPERLSPGRSVSRPGESGRTFGPFPRAKKTKRDRQFESPSLSSESVPNRFFRISWLTERRGF